MDRVADDRLMREVRDGDVRKLGELFERHHVALFNFYLRMGEDRAGAEDMVQDVFFRMLRFRHTFKDGTPFATWMYSIARNTRIDHFRKSRRETALGPEENVTADRRPSAAASLELKQETDLVRRALYMLPEDKRELLVLARYQELKYEQIAELVGCEVGTLKVRIYRAVRQLREIFFELRAAPGARNWSAGQAGETV
jgi:RNA polymerase sigma factor (sigma-70 family)